MTEKTARTRPTPKPAAPLAALLLAVLLALPGCGGEGDAAQEAPADASKAPSAPAENPLAGDSPLEGGGSPLEGGDASSNSGGSDAGGSGSEPSARESSASEPSGGGGSASAEDVPDVSGGWSGTATDETGEEARLQFDLEQNGATLSGTAYFRTDGDEAVPVEPLRGSVDDTGAVELVHESARGQGSWSFAGALDGDSIAGESTLTREDDSGGQQTSQASFAVSRTSAQ